jgi:thiol-disulfide isomerase/thioredoxin
MTASESDSNPGPGSATSPEAALPDRPSRLGLWILLAALALIVVGWELLRPYWQTPNEGISHPSVGRPLPDLELAPLIATDKELSKADLSGQVAVINFWGTWCGPCVHEFPHIAELDREYGSRSDFRLVSVSCKESDSQSLAELRQLTEAFLRQRRRTMVVYADPRYRTRSAASAVGAFGYGYPTTIVIDRQGTIRGVWNGYHRGIEFYIDRLVSELLNEETPAKPTTRNE